MCKYDFFLFVWFILLSFINVFRFIIFIFEVDIYILFFVIIFYNNLCSVYIIFGVLKSKLEI